VLAGVIVAAGHEHRALEFGAVIKA
jgi:hypothetical protein